MSVFVLQSVNLKFPLPVVQCSFDICRICKYCCQWCEYITDKGCSAPGSYEVLSLCKSFPVLIGQGLSRNPSLGLWEDQYPPEFGAFVPLGRHCMATMDERQRAIFQTAAKWINQGKREFVLYEECMDYFLLITVQDPIKQKNRSDKIEKTPTEIITILSVEN